MAGANLLGKPHDACETSVPQGPQELDAIEIGMDSDSSSSMRHCETSNQQCLESVGSETRETESDMIVTETDGTDLQIKKLTKSMAQSIANMEVLNPEVLRVTRACQAFEHFGAALRPRHRGLFHQKSRKNHKISTFWSHSWRGGQWKKILTLLIFYNGVAAVSLGFLAALLMMLLFSFGLLPGLERQYYDYDHQIKVACWSLCSGCIVTSLVMIFWRSQTEVFLDRICISQVDQDLKAQAVFSLAGLLRKSDMLLILWDPTWTGRLWCLFELAAFLQSQKTQDKVLIIRPILLGPVSMVLFFVCSACILPAILVPQSSRRTSWIASAAILLVSLAVGFPGVSIVRKYFRDLDDMRQQLLSISFSTACCSCCALDHVGPSGEVIPCDRKILKECVKIWFGSELAFENIIRSEVVEILNRDLSERIFSTPWLLGVSAPIMWLYMDAFSSWTPTSYPLWWENPAVSLPIEGVVIWLVAMPSASELNLCFCRIMRARPQSFYLEFLKNLMTLLLNLVPYAVIVICMFLCRSIGEFKRIHRAAAFVGCMLLLSPCSFLLTVGLKALLRQPGW